MNPSTYSIPLDIQRISSDILDLGVASFLDLAIIAPDIWHRLSDPDERRQVAELLGWPTVCIQDLFEAMTLTDFVTVFFNAGIKTIEDLWQRFPYACDYLRKTGRIDSIIQLLKFAPERTVFPDDLAFFLSAAVMPEALKCGAISTERLFNRHSACVWSTTLLARFLIACCSMWRRKHWPPLQPIRNIWGRRLAPRWYCTPGVRH